jgi:hypothetical protein
MFCIHEEDVAPDMLSATRAYIATTDAAATGNWAKVLVAYKTAVLASNHDAKSFAYRFHSVSGLASAIENYFPRSDVALLKQVSRGQYGDDGETMALASNAIGMAKRGSGDREGSVRQFKRTLKLVCNKGRRVFVAVGGSLGSHELSEVLFQEMQKTARRCIQAMEQPLTATTLRSARDQFEDEEGEEKVVEIPGSFSDAERDIIRKLNPHHYSRKKQTQMRYMCNPTDAPFAERCTRVRGNACDGCGAQVTLMMCQKCKKRWYCGLKCQRAEWKRHKQVCRTVGDLRVGDRVIIRGLQVGDCEKEFGGMETKFNGAVVTIVGIADKELNDVVPVHTCEWVWWRVKFDNEICLFVGGQHLHYMMDDGSH